MVQSGMRAEMYSSTNLPITFFFNYRPSNMPLPLYIFCQFFMSTENIPQTMQQHRKLQTVPAAGTSELSAGLCSTHIQQKFHFVNVSLCHCSTIVYRQSHRCLLRQFLVLSYPIAAAQVASSYDIGHARYYWFHTHLEERWVG